MLNLFLSFLFILPLMAAPRVSQEDFRKQALAAIDYMSTNPANVGGYATIASPVYLAKSNVNLGPLNASYAVRINANKHLSWNLDEDSMDLNSAGAITVFIQGIPIHIKNIHYNKNGHFKVDINFGWSKRGAGVLEKLIESKMAKIIEDKYKAKMERVFTQLKVLRSQRSPKDAKNVVDGIFAIFNDGPPVPGVNLANVGMQGNVSLAFQNPRDKTLQISNEYVADLKAGDNIIFNTDFSRQNGRMTLRSLEMTSSEGIIFRPPGKTARSSKAGGVTRVTLNESGWDFTGISSVEVGLTETAQLVGLIFSAAGASGIGRGLDCDPRWAEIQAFLKNKLGSQLAVMVRRNRKALIEAGISPILLNQID